jgi:hypothetical protein
MLPTLFMRIHKTGGEALAKQIRDRLPEPLVCPLPFEWQIRELSGAVLRQYRFFEGHITPSSLQAVFDTPRVFTVLRAPRERLLSCYFYWKEGSRHARTRFFDTISDMTLSEFLRSDEPIIRRVTWNVQARLLAGGQFGGVDGLRQNVFGPFISERDLAAVALDALERLAFVGITERYEISLRDVYRLLDLGEPPPPEYVNVTASKPASYEPLLAVPEIAEALDELTWADQIVYEAACARLACVPAGQVHAGGLND